MNHPQLKAAESCCKISNEKLHNIYIVENSKILRAGLRCHLNCRQNLNVAGECDYRNNYVQEIRNSKADVILFSSFMRNKENVKAIEFIKKDSPCVKTLILSEEADEEEFYQSVLLGVDGYCVSNSEPDKIIKAINIVTCGGRYIDHSMGSFIHRIIQHMGQMEQMPIDKPIEEQIGLTQREIEIMQIAKSNKSYNDIAGELSISANTVKIHFSNIYKKLGVKNRLEAILKLDNRLNKMKLF